MTESTSTVIYSQLSYILHTITVNIEIINLMLAIAIKFCLILKKKNRYVLGYNTALIFFATRDYLYMFIACSTKLIEILQER